MASKFPMSWNNQKTFRTECKRSENNFCGVLWKARGSLCATAIRESARNKRTATNKLICSRFGELNRIFRLLETVWDGQPNIEKAFWLFYKYSLYSFLFLFIFHSTLQLSSKKSRCKNILYTTNRLCRITLTVAFSGWGHRYCINVSLRPWP